MKCYDTNVFINLALINKAVRNKILEELEKGECIIPRSIEQELLLKHFPELSRRLWMLHSSCKPSFEAMLNSRVFKQFKDDYFPLANHIIIDNKNFENGETLILNLIEEISNLSTLILSFKPFFPQTMEEFKELEENPTKHYQELRNLVKIKDSDSKHLALLELYGEQLNSAKSEKVKIQFLSCDKAHFVGFWRKLEIRRKYKFIEPVSCKDWIKTLGHSPTTETFK